jgi:hypothetical protein
MNMLVCFLEEPSAKAMLEGILPRLLPENFMFKCIHFSGKQDLEKQLERKLRGWQEPDTVFLILRDQDSADCKTVKKNLLELCRKSGKSKILVRIACHELESFYFGDLNAVEQGLELPNLSKSSMKAEYRVPDNIINPSQELQRLTGGKYQKLSGSREIAKYLSLEDNTSQSFKALIAGIRRLAFT